MRTRLTRLFLASIAAASLAACSNSNNSSVPFVGLNNNTKSLTYIAIGDSLTAGLGTSLCGPPPNINSACVTSPTNAGVSAVKTNYSADIAANLRANHATFNYIPLGVSGAATGDAPLPENPASGDILTNPAQIPALGGYVSTARGAGSKVLISLLIGPNDVTDAFYTIVCAQAGGHPIGGGGASQTNPCAASGTSLADNIPPAGNVLNGSFYKGYLAVLNAIAATNPDAVIVIGLPDASKTPTFASQPAQVLALINGLVQQANGAAKAALAASSLGSKGIFFDTYAQGVANPFLYSPQFFSGDGYHPNDTGYGNLASAVYPVITASFPNI